jgi:hypothetical protein
MYGKVFVVFTIQKYTLLLLKCYIIFVHTLRSVFMNSPPPKPEVILTNFFAEPTVLLVPITSREITILRFRFSSRLSNKYLPK